MSDSFLPVVINNIVFVCAAVTAVLCGDRLRQVNWFTHLSRFVLVPLCFTVWCIFLALDAADGGAQWYDVAGLLGVATWFSVTQTSWAGGPPSYSYRPRPLTLTALHDKIVGGHK
jgi:hypothetical protein